MLGNMQPELAIFVETNLKEGWNPFPQLYTAFRTFDSENRGILILTKSELIPRLLHLWEDKGICIELTRLKLLVIGLYTPYYKDFVKGKEILSSWSVNKRWIAFGDHESSVTQFAKFGDYYFLPKYSRKINGKYSATDSIYGNLAIKNAALDVQISDHYVLKCEVSPGVKLLYKAEKNYKRSEIMKWALKKNSRLRRKILESWPSIPLSHLVKGCVPKRKVERSIWVPTIKPDASKEEARNYKRKLWKQIQAYVLNCVNSNNLAKLAKTARKLLGILNKTPFQKGTCDERGQHLIDDEADQYFANYYRRLYAMEAGNSCVIKDLKSESPCEFDILLPPKKISMHKAMSVDLFPDELLEDKELQKKVYQWGCVKMRGAPIEKIYKQGRLVLLSKVASEYPAPYDTRPIVIFSAVRKYLEYMWIDKYGKEIWKHIGPWQGGFRVGHGTQELVVNLCKWLHKNRKAAIGIFIDVEKAFDSTIRAQVIELVKKTGIDAIGLKVLCELLQNTTIEYKGYTIEYNRGVPQGSVLSPLLFNLVFDEVLKEGVANGWFVQAYADDLFVGITSIKEYPKVLAWLDSWKHKISFKVKDDKTKEFRIGRYKRKI
eukprot:TRINITY_DN7764_c0_g1_i9.p2 TRINITY_DN7764_c0_g1~~TRINITY_DN7764_c0_g1_i9.p2  ORF type:complete len:603 (+),score=32.88 TRINITY_DN7764_c0_g1_i9:2400-4208(+)